MRPLDRGGGQLSALDRPLYRGVNIEDIRDQRLAKHYDVIEENG